MGELKMGGLFVHMPKCAGSSIRLLLEELHPDKFVFSYNSYFRLPFYERLKVIANDFESPFPVQTGQYIYGHFLPIKHLGKTLSPSLKLTMILRDPLERMRSHYMFWNAGQFDHYLWKKMKTEEWSFADFAFCAEMRNFYCQYSVHVPIERYDFIGLYENLDASVTGCFKALGLDLPVGKRIPFTNISPEPEDSLISTIDQAAFKEWHSNDYEFYEGARKRFHSAEVKEAIPLR